MKYPVAERFKAPQGEGLYAGKQMSFVRLVGCSVGKGVCHACDTDFDRMLPSLGGGAYTPEEILEWTNGDDPNEGGPTRHVCLTGGEPLDRDLGPLVAVLVEAGKMVHLETSGTKEIPDWALGKSVDELWITVSPKPGFLEKSVEDADEVKVILGGLGDGPGWPNVDDAVRWSLGGKLVYVQPRNGTVDVDFEALERAKAVVAAHSGLRLSVQLHKLVRTR